MSVSTFRTAAVRTPNGPGSIEIIDVPVVEPGPGEVRVEIAAAPVNPVDLAVARGLFHAMGLINQPERTGLGWDFAGTVVVTGPGVDLAAGTRVAGLVDGFDRDFGTYAEQLVVRASDIAVVPDGLELIAASTVPLNGPPGPGQGRGTRSLRAQALTSSPSPALVPFTGAKTWAPCQSPHRRQKTNGASMIWKAGFRTAVISPYEQIQLTEPRGFADQTVRQVLHMAGGGERLRVRLTNRYGRTPLTIAAARVATEHGQAVLTFDGAEKIVIPPGEEAAGDPVDLPVASGADLFLSLYLPEETGLATYSHMPMETAHIVGGNHVTSPALPGAEQVEARFYVSGVDVLTPDDTALAVAFGDSWFEGVGSTTGANNRSVDFLNRRLKRGWVVNQGIAGNRLLRDEVGEHALARFDHDVLPIPGLTHVLVHFGINDLGLPGMSGEPPATSDALIEGFKVLAHRAHKADLKILAATIGPFAGAAYPGISTPEGLAARREVNDWIRTTDTFDAVFDVARAVENPEAPDYIHPALDSGDGMHLNDKGAQAMANAVNLETLAL